MTNIRNIGAVKILDAVTVTGPGPQHNPRSKDRTFELVGQTSAGAGAASVDVEVSNDGVNWINLANISLTLSTTTSSDGTASSAAWRFVRGNVASISGTGASVDLIMGG